MSIRSHVMFKNCTQHAVEISLEKESEHARVLPTVQPGESIPIPVEFAFASLRVRPYQQHYEWSSEEDLSQLQTSLGKHLVKCPSAFPTDSFFFLLKIQGDKEGFDRYTN